MSEIMLARQPIFDSSSQTFAYELLYRGVGDISDIDDVELTAQVLSNTLNEMGIALLTERHKLFINVSKAFLMSDYPALLPPAQTVLEVLEDVPADAEVIEAIQRWKKAGYTIALDDFINSTDQQAKLLGYADIIKVDLMEKTEDLGSMVSHLRQFDVELLAEKVEDQQMFDRCRELGFDYFQGYFFCKPKVMVSKSLKSNKFELMQLLDKTLRAQTASELQNDISYDLSLSYKLLRYINSAAVGLRGEIKSIGHALNLLGINNIRLWLSIILLTAVGNDKPSELMALALSRGRFLERWAEHHNKHLLSSDYFILGMFSTLDAMLDQDLWEVTGNMSLPDTVSNGLFEDDSDEATALALIYAIELAAWDDVTRIAEQLGTAVNELSPLYIEATSWADERLKALL